MKGIILAGGAGSRLWPVTRGVSKHLLPVFDKPLVYYPISVLMLAGIREILVVTTGVDLEAYKKVLGNGERFGVEISYIVQHEPRGIADAFILGAEFIGGDQVCLVLGDNIFWGQGLSDQLKKCLTKTGGATIFGHRVRDPERFGVVEFDSNNNPRAIHEKPNNPPSDLAVTGLYMFDNRVVEIARNVEPSDRGELEITSILNHYLNAGSLTLEIFGRGFAWLDTGTSSALLEAALFIETIERQQGFKVACLEEIALLNSWISKDQLAKDLSLKDKSSYGLYLRELVE